MRPDFAEEIVEQFERGGLSRRQLASRLMGLGAALAVLPGTARGDEDRGGTFRATGLDHAVPGEAEGRFVLSGSCGGMDMAKAQPGDVSIGKFDILATYTYAKALHVGLDDDEAKRRGLVAAVMGAKARTGTPAGAIRTTIRPTRKPPRGRSRRPSPPSPSTGRSPTSWAHFFDGLFLPGLKKLVEAGLSYDEVKKVLKIPATWGAKIGGARFRERISAYLQARGGEPHR